MDSARDVCGSSSFLDNTHAYCGKTLPQQSSGTAVFRSQARSHRAFAQGFERRVLFAIDEETAEINRRLKETLDE
jgi:hypothetical protein